jgi:hypothetical protein
MREKPVIKAQTAYDTLGIEDKNDHGNENVFPAYTTESFTSIPIAGEKPIVSPPMAPKFNTDLLDTPITPNKTEYVDHTQPTKGQSKVKIFSNETKLDTEIEYNEFLRINNGKIKTQGAHDHVTRPGEEEPLVFTIYLYYEETKQ